MIVGLGWCLDLMILRVSSNFDILGFCRMPGSQDPSCAPTNPFPAWQCWDCHRPPAPQGDHHQMWGHVSQLMPGPRNPCEPSL